MADEYEKRLEKTSVYGFIAAHFPSLASAAIIKHYEELGISEPWKDRFLGWAIEGYFEAQNLLLQGAKELPGGFSEAYHTLTDVIKEGHERYSKKFDNTKIKDLEDIFLKGIEIPDNFKKLIRKYGDKTILKIGVKKEDLKEKDKEKRQKEINKKLEDPKIYEQEGFKEILYKTLMTKIRKDYLPGMVETFKSFLEYRAEFINETEKSNLKEEISNLEKKVDELKKKKKD